MGIKTLLKSAVSIITFISVTTAFAGAGDSGIFSTYTDEDFNKDFPKRNKVYTYEGFRDAYNHLSGVKLKIMKRENPDGTLINYTYKILREDRFSNKTELTVGTDYNASWNIGKPEIITAEVDFSKFCNSGDMAKDKAALAGFFANISQETKGGSKDERNDGLAHVRELDCSPQKYDGRYDVNSSGDPKFDKPHAQAYYYGRGAKQLSYPTNYGIFSFVFFGDHNVLMQHPERVEALDYSVNPIGSENENNLVEEYQILPLASAIYFWMMPEGAKPSCNDVINTYRGFAKTINVINGGVETREYNTFHCASVSRTEYYKHFRTNFGIPIPSTSVESTKEYLSPWNMRPNNFDDIKHNDMSAGPVQPCPCVNKDCPFK